MQPPEKELAYEHFLLPHCRSYYSVLLGYCVYYVIFFLVKDLPESLELAEEHFDNLQVSVGGLCE